MERPVMRSAAWASRYVVDADSRTNRGEFERAHHAGNLRARMREIPFGL